MTQQQPKAPPPQVLAEIHIHISGEEAPRVYRQAIFNIRPVSEHLTNYNVETTAGSPDGHALTIFNSEWVREIKLVPSALAQPEIVNG